MQEKALPLLTWGEPVRTTSTNAPLHALQEVNKHEAADVQMMPRLPGWGSQSPAVGRQQGPVQLLPRLQPRGHSTTALRPGARPMRHTPLTDTNPATKDMSCFQQPHS